MCANKQVARRAQIAAAVLFIISTWVVSTGVDDAPSVSNILIFVTFNLRIPAEYDDVPLIWLLATRRVQFVAGSLFA